jgi:murein L,D-transpeptidase YcbB/YkuD
LQKRAAGIQLSFPKKSNHYNRDTSDVILQIRKRLFITGDLIIDSRQKIFDNELLEGVLKYKKRNGLPQIPYCLQHIENMNITVHERIKTIMVNMERSDGCHTTIQKAIYSGEHSIIYANLFQGKACTRIQSGSRKSMNKTAVFSGQMNQIVFSPYWNVPSSILRKEILPAIAKINYLAKHDMEWVGRRVRQRPGHKMHWVK